MRVQKEHKQAVVDKKSSSSFPGAVPVRPPHRHSVLSPASRLAASQRGPRPGEAAVSSDHRRCRGTGSEEWSYSLLDSGETTVWIVDPVVDV